MRILLAPFGSRGDVQPMLALGVTLRDRGHHVTVCAPPDYTDWIHRLGLEGHAVGVSMQEFVARSAEGLRGIRYAMGAFPRLIGDQFGALEPHARDCEVMLGSTLTAAGPAFAEKFGLRYHYVSFTPCVIPSAEYPSLFTKTQTLPRWLNKLSWWMSNLSNDMGLRTTINAERKKLGLASIRHVWRHMVEQRLIIAAEPKLASLPADGWPGVTQTGPWFLPEQEELPPELEAFLSAGPPPVYIGFGSMPDGKPERTTQRVLEAIRLAGVRAIVAKGASWLGSGALPEGVIAIGPTPHGKLFPRCSAIVHHGGAGTVATAARAGVPQLVVPHMTDQFYWRRRLEERGLMPGPVRLDRPETLAAALKRCAEDTELRARTAALAREMTLDGLARAVRLVETGQP